MIHFIMLSRTTSDRIYKMTQNAISSIVNSKCPEFPFEPGKLVVIESNKSFFGQYQHASSVFYDKQYFNYNHALNLGLSAVNADLEDDNQWFCFMNNDIVCERDWLVSLQKVAIDDNDIVSLSPRCKKVTADEVECGYTLGRHMQGYCFLSNSRALRALGGKFDETFNFYFQDDDYLETLRTKGLKHAVVKSSVVYHLGQQTTGNEDIRLLVDGRDKFIAKWSLQTYLEREAAKRIADN